MPTLKNMYQWHQTANQTNSQYNTVLAIFFFKPFDFMFKSTKIK